MNTRSIGVGLVWVVLLLSLFTATAGAQCYGDFDCSGTVDGADLSVFAEHYGSTNCSIWLGEIIGTLSCPEGGLIAGAMVHVPGDSFISITDDLGQFKLRSVPDGTYTIAVRLNNEEIGREESVEVQGDAVTIVAIEATICQEICDGLDNDFDGVVDEDLVAEPCPLQAGVCAGSVKVCGGAAGWLPCDASTYFTNHDAYENMETTCDNLDNDCDGTVDGMQQICGFDVGTCQLGIETCTDGVWGDCDGAIWPTDEICGDLLDNDCDGQIDDGC